MLLISIVFICIKITVEWIHYFYIIVPDTPVAERTYTVDILTTFCAGEPYDMIVECLTAIQAITYPHQAYLCDEADDPYLKSVCQKLGVHHITRTDKTDAKAGNINNALKYASGEICVVLDPDHIPFPEFLDPIIPHFNDPGIGYVQIVQAYRNFDQTLIAKGAAQQTFQFYGPIMMAMNKYGTVLAIGANCTFRRAALNSIGGHAAGLAEDMHTAMKLHAAGWKSIYVPIVLARGLVPSTLSAYYKQQLKWSRGVFELWVKTYPALFKKFTWQQKLHYGIIPLHYLSGLVFLINFLIPVLALSFDISPINIDMVRFAIFGVPLTVAIILIRHFVQWWVMEDEERGFHVVGGLLMIGTWWVYLLGFLYTLIRKDVPYIPTPKSYQVEKNTHLNIPNLLVVAISLCAVFYGLHAQRNLYTIIMSGFALLNCFIVLFSVAASRQQHFRVLKSEKNIIQKATTFISEFKASFWLMRRRFYTRVRSTALLITAFTTFVLVYVVVSYSRVGFFDPRFEIPIEKAFNWQEVQTGKVLTFDGVKSVYGNSFPYYHLDVNSKTTALPHIKILLPAKATFAGTLLTYHVVMLKNELWQLAGDADALQYKWELVKNTNDYVIDQVQYLGDGASISFNIPVNPSMYQLYLYVSDGLRFEIIRSELNTPL